MSLIEPRIRHRNLPLLLSQVRDRVISHFRPILKAHGITEQQWRIVRVLLETPELEPREIGELCGISSPSLVGVLSRMEQLGFVKRRRDVHDQRRVHVSSTPRSQALAARMAPQIEATYRNIEGASGGNLMNRLETLLDEALASLPQVGADSSQDVDTDSSYDVVPAQIRAKRAAK